ITGEERGFDVALFTIDKLLTSSNIAYAVTGALAFGLHIPNNPRNTKDINLLIKKSDKAKLIKTLKDNQLKYREEDTYHLNIIKVAGLPVDVLFSFADTELSGIVESKRALLFGVTVSVIKPEYLAWMYLDSDRPQHKVDFTEMVKQKSLSINKLYDLLEDDGDIYALEELKRLTKIS
ncbi:MAG: hypothetical protein HXX81_07765, partial [Campylobacterales bacterium]|nr:hypothetical protein [Campylobacterales bacterium]